MCIYSKEKTHKSDKFALIFAKILIEKMVDVHQKQNFVSRHTQVTVWKKMARQDVRYTMQDAGCDDRVNCVRYKISHENIEPSYSNVS